MQFEASTTSMNDLLTTQETATLREQYWQRYRIRYMPHLTCGHTLLSRIRKELDEHRLTAHLAPRASPLRSSSPHPTPPPPPPAPHPSHLHLRLSTLQVQRLGKLDNPCPWGRPHVKFHLTPNPHWWTGVGGYALYPPEPARKN